METDMIPNQTAPTHRRTIRTLALAGVLILGLAAVALGSSGPLKLKSSVDSAEKTVVVNPAGHTLYSLTPETSHHLLCGPGCRSIWPPLTVPSRSTKIVLGSAIKGTLGLVRRGKNVLQVTFRGRPVYRYSGDHAKGEANGDGIEADGGIWHPVSPTAAAAPTSPTTPTPPPATPMPPPYKY
jgi:predicted lipoprotein with Yx(FWY)xxD motif